MKAVTKVLLLTVATASTAVAQFWADDKPLLPPGLGECAADTNSLLAQQDIHDEFQSLEQKFESIRILENCPVRQGASSAFGASLVTETHACDLDWSTLHHELEQKCNAAQADSYFEAHHAIQCMAPHEKIVYQITMTHVPNCVSTKCSARERERTSTLEVERMAHALSQAHRMHCASDVRIHNGGTEDAIDETMDEMHLELEQELQEREDAIQQEMENSGNNPNPYTGGMPSKEDLINNDLSNGSIEYLEQQGAEGGPLAQKKSSRMGGSGSTEEQEDDDADAATTSSRTGSLPAGMLLLLICMYSL